MQLKVFSLMVELNDLRTLELRLRSVSRKIRQNSRWLAYYVNEICMIGLLGVMYDYCVSPAHSEIVLIYKELKANSEIMAFWKLGGVCDTMS